MEEAGNTGMKCQNETNPITYRKIRNGINHNKRKRSFFIAAKVRPAVPRIKKTGSILKSYSKELKNVSVPL